MQPILTIDLTSGAIQPMEIPLTWAQEYLGGSALAARLLYEHLTPDLEPLSPQAPLLFLTGPLTGTAGPAVGRFTVNARSPATGLWGEANGGGFWGPALRQAGYDGLWITGQASQPVCLCIRDGEVSIRTASHLWGLDTYATQTAVSDELGGGRVRVAVIGPAGEATLPFASIMCDHGRFAGRAGMGAVMGAKRLKAIAVAGSGSIPLPRPGAFQHVRSQINRDLRQDNLSAVLRAMGSAGGSDYFDYLGDMPKRYFRAGLFEGAARISGASMAEEILVGVSTCHGCVIACGRVVDVGDGVKRKGPEYETMVGFGPNLELDDLVVITHLGELCDHYGMDTISTSNVIGLAFALFEDGFLTTQDTGGLQLHWGEAAVVERLVHLTARREGFGAQLAEGSRALARRYATEEAAVQVNGLEVPYHDPRGTSGMALVYATSPRGACHNQSDYFMVDIGQADETLGLDLHPRQAGAEKAANVARHQDWRTVCNALVMCFFANVPPADALTLVNAACGLDWDLEDLLRMGERAWNLKRAINHRLGLRRADDRLPKALLTPLPDGGAAGYVPDVGAMLAAYYEARGWDPETGKPGREKLMALGLGEVAEDLWPLT